VMWNYTTGGAVASSPAVADDTVFVGSYDKKMYALNATSGAHLWSYITLDKVVSSPAVADGAIYFGSYDHLVYAVGDSSSSPQTYEVLFAASGLPPGTSWAVTLNGQTEDSTSDTIVFNVPNGVYSFSVTSPPDYTAYPSSGTVTVNAMNGYQQITFTSARQEFPWLLVASLAAGAVLLALAITAFVLYRRKNER
jgi:outer membrane protein assembly factor BamB